MKSKPKNSQQILKENLEASVSQQRSLLLDKDEDILSQIQYILLPSSGNIITNDFLLNRSKQSILNLCQQQIEIPPSLSVKIVGTRMMGGKNNNNNDNQQQQQQKFVDFSYTIEDFLPINNTDCVLKVDRHVNRKKKSVKDLIRRYVKSPAKKKRLVLEKRVEWSFSKMGKSIQSYLKSDLGYEGRVDVFFLIKNNLMEINNYKTAKRRSMNSQTDELAEGEETKGERGKGNFDLEEISAVYSSKRIYEQIDYYDEKSPKHRLLCFLSCCFLCYFPFKWFREKSKRLLRERDGVMYCRYDQIPATVTDLMDKLKPLLHLGQPGG